MTLSLSPLYLCKFMSFESQYENGIIDHWLNEEYDPIEEANYIANREFGDDLRQDIEYMKEVIHELREGCQCSTCHEYYTRLYHEKSEEWEKDDER